MPKLPQILAVPVKAPLYGSSRLGSRKERVCMTCTTATLPAELQGISYVIRGEKSYELSNHLGNVLAVVSDRREPGSCTDSLVDFYYADGRSVSDYYPFGMAMDSRTQSGGGYRWGFNGMEKYDDWQGEGNSYDFGFRIYDPRLGRFLSTDPLTHKYPWYSPYIFGGNKPIWNGDINGLYEYPKNKASEYSRDYPMLTKYLSQNVENDVMSSPIILDAMLKYSGGNLTQEEIQKAVTWNSGVNIVFDKSDMFAIGENGLGIYADYRDPNNGYPNQPKTIHISAEFAQNVENILAGHGSEEDKMAALYEFFAVLTHETVHYGDYLDGSRMSSKDYSFGGEPGKAFQMDVFESVLDDYTGERIHGKLSIHLDSSELIEIQKQEGRGEILPTLPNN